MDVRVLQTLCKRAFWVGCSSPPHFFAVEYLASKEHHHWNTPASHSADCVSHSWLMLLCCNFHIENCWSLVWATVPWSLDAVRFLSRFLYVCPFCDKFLRQLCLFGAAYSPLAYTRAFTKLLTHIHGKHPDWLWVWNNKFKTPST